MQRADSSMRTINRICDILNSFRENETDLTLTEISSRIGIPKSTTHRLIQSLKSQELLINENDRQSYRLGFQLIRWGTMAQKSINIRNIALPIMRSLTQITGESSVLSIRTGNTGVWIEMVESEHPVRLEMRMGKSLSLHAGASAKVLWAFLPEADMEQILSEIELIPITPNTIIDKNKMREELIKGRNQGYVTSFEETDIAVMGIAAPVYDHHGHVIAGIGIVAPTSRITPEQTPEIGKQVIQAGHDLSKMIGGSNQ
ncbi:MAG: IclR family transcriptional regulator [Leptolinea sp.]